MDAAAAARWAASKATHAKAQAAVQAGAAQGLTPLESLQAAGIDPQLEGFGNVTTDVNAFNSNLAQMMGVAAAKGSLAQTAAPAAAMPSWTPWAVGAAAVGGAVLLWRHFRK